MSTSIVINSETHLTTPMATGNGKRRRPSSASGPWVIEDDGKSTATTTQTTSTGGETMNTFTESSSLSVVARSAVDKRYSLNFWIDGNTLKCLINIALHWASANSTDPFPSQGLQRNAIERSPRPNAMGWGCEISFECSAISLKYFNRDKIWLVLRCAAAACCFPGVGSCIEVWATVRSLVGSLCSQGIGIVDVEMIPTGDTMIPPCNFKDCLFEWQNRRSVAR